MPYFQSSQNENESINLYYEDLGEGKPVLFIHGWPLSGSMWEYQVTELTQKGYRCITYDRRGFGKSDKPYGPYDYNTLAADLNALIIALGLQDVTLAGFSMGGGEIAKYFSLYGGANVSKVILISTVLPYMLQTDSNPEGIPQEAFNEMAKGMMEDRPKFMEAFGKEFFGVSLIHQTVSDAFLANNLTKVMEASPIATLQCARSFSSTDFRLDVPMIHVPALVIHGDADKIVPIKPTSDETVKMLSNVTYKIYEGAPHGLWYTEKERLNSDMMAFI